MAWVVPAMVVVAMMSAWLSSSCSDGMGRRGCFEPSMDSPHNFRCQSMKVPLFAFTSVSLTITVQVPIPDSPLLMLMRTDICMRCDLPMNDRHESPVFISCRALVQPSCSSKMADNLVGTDQFYTEVTSTRMINIHRHSDVFKALKVCFLEHSGSNFKRNCKAIVALWNRLVDVNPW